MIKKLLILTSGNFASPLIMLAITPIISRLYSIEVIGIYHWVVSCSFFYGIFFTLQIHHSLISEKSNVNLDVKFNSILWIMIYSFFIFIFLSIIIGLVFDLELDLIFYSCLMAFFSSFTLILSTYLARLNAIALLSKVMIVRTMVLSFLVIVFSFYSELISLVLASVLSELSVVAFVIGKVNFKYKRFLRSKKFIVKELVVNIKNIRYILPSQILTNTSNILVLSMIKHVSLTSLGLYALLFRVVASPLYAVGNALRSIFYLQLIKSDKKFKFINIYVFSISLIGLVFSVVYYLIDVPFLEYVLGAQFLGVDSYFPFFFIWVVSSVVNILPTEVFKHTGNQFLVLRAELISFILKAICIGTVFIHKDLFDILIFYPLSFYIINLLMLIYYYKYLNKALKSV